MTKLDILGDIRRDFSLIADSESAVRIVAKEHALRLIESAIATVYCNNDCTFDEACDHVFYQIATELERESAVMCRELLKYWRQVDG